MEAAGVSWSSWRTFPQTLLPWLEEYHQVLIAFTMGKIYIVFKIKSYIELKLCVNSKYFILSTKNIYE